MLITLHDDEALYVLDALEYAIETSQSELESLNDPDVAEARAAIIKKAEAILENVRRQVDDATAEKLWSQLEDVPMDPETEQTEAPFLHFPAGTHREEIWHWFDEQHSKGVYYLLYERGDADV